jgi:hypothetical protein
MCSRYSSPDLSVGSRGLRGGVVLGFALNWVLLLCVVLCSERLHFVSSSARVNTVLQQVRRELAIKQQTEDKIIKHNIKL